MAVDGQDGRDSRRLDAAADRASSRRHDHVDCRRWLVAWDAAVLICFVIAPAPAPALVALIPSLASEYHVVILGMCSLGGAVEAMLLTLTLNSEP